MSQHADVIIIGSGISALTSAALLSKRGKSVIVLERYLKPGGYMHSFKRDGESFETGAHYFGALGEGQPFRILLEYLGVYRPELFTKLNSNAFDIFHFPEGRVHFPQGYEEVISELGSIFPNERAAIRSYFEKIRQMVKLFPTYDFNDTPEYEMNAEALELSLAAVVESLTQNTRLQSVFYAYCGLHGVHPRDVAFGLHALVTDSLILGPYGLTGNGDILTNEFVKVIRENGSQVIMRKNVKNIQVQNSNVTEVETETGEKYTADWVISSIHPKATFRLLSDQSILSPAFTSRLSSLKESTGLFGLYGVCRERPPFDPASNYYFFKSSDPRSLFEAQKFGDEPVGVFMSPQKRTWTPDDQQFGLSFHCETPWSWYEKWKDERLGKRSEEYTQFKKAYSGQLLKLVDRYVPQFSEMLIYQTTSTPLSNLHFNGSEEGSPYGIYHSIQNTGPRALGPRTKVRNLLLTGQSCLFPGLMGAAISGMRTTGHIVGIKSMITDLKAMRDGT